MNITHRTFRAILLALCLFGGTGLALAQGTNLGTIRGTVADSNGAVVAGAKVQVTDLATDLAREVVSDREGNYEVTGLKSGSYKVTVVTQGFKTAAVNQVSLRGGDTVRADVAAPVRIRPRSLSAPGRPVLPGAGEDGGAGPGCRHRRPGPGA